jgi:hypothetical protein
LVGLVPQTILSCARTEQWALLLVLFTGHYNMVPRPAKWQRVGVQPALSEPCSGPRNTHRRILATMNLASNMPSPIQTTRTKLEIARKRSRLDRGARLEIASSLPGVRGSRLPQPSPRPDRARRHPARQGCGRHPCIAPARFSKAEQDRRWRSGPLVSSRPT